MRWFVLSLGLLAACASQPQTKNVDRGVSAIPLAADAYQITVTGNAFTDRRKMNEMSLLKAAQLAESNGYSHFVIQDAATYKASAAAQEGLAASAVYDAPKTFGMVKPGVDVIARFVPEEHAAQVAALSVSQVYGLYGAQYGVSSAPSAPVAAAAASVAPAATYTPSAPAAPAAPAANAPNPVASTNQFAVVAPAPAPIPPLTPTPVSTPEPLAAALPASTAPAAPVVVPAPAPVAPQASVVPVAATPAAPAPVALHDNDAENSAYQCAQMQRDLVGTISFTNTCDHDIYIFHCIENDTINPCGARENRYFTQFTDVAPQTTKKVYDWDVSDRLRYHACKSPQHTDLGDGRVSCR